MPNSGPQLTTAHGVLLLVFTVWFCFADGSESGTNNATVTNVCIIGTGIAGASAAHFLTAQGVAANNSIQLVMFDRNGHVGGRIETVSFGDGAAVDAGASIIANRNKLMAHFVEQLNLKRNELSDKNSTTGLWDGRRYRFVTARSPLTTLVKLVYRYRRSLFRMRSVVASMLDRYDALYPSDLGSIGSWRGRDTVEALFKPTKGLYDLTHISLDEAMRDTFSPLFMEEMASAITRVNYNHEMSQMNALAGCVALAGSGASLWAVKGGNVLVVKGLIERSQARVLLNTDIVRVDQNADSKQYTLTSRKGATWRCDSVILAAPFERSSLSVPDLLGKAMDVGRKFQQTVATFVQGELNTTTFGFGGPDDTLTTAHSESDFSSVSVVYTFGNGTRIYKVFSKIELSPEVFSRIFAPGAIVRAVYPWHAYPKFSVPERFAAFAPDPAGMFFYTSPIESAGSAMEMSAISGANSAALLLERLWQRSMPSTTSTGKDEL